MSLMVKIAFINAQAVLFQDDFRDVAIVQVGKEVYRLLIGRKRFKNSFLLVSSLFIP